MPVKLLFASEFFWPYSGGAEVSAFLILSRLAQRGYRICVMTSHVDGEKTYESFNGIEVYRSSLFFSEQSLNIFRRYLFYLKSILVLIGVIAREKPAVILTQQLISPSALVVSKLYRIPILVLVHDYWPVCYYRTLLSPSGMICSSCDKCFEETRRCSQSHIGTPTSVESINNLVWSLYAVLICVHTTIVRHLLRKADAVVGVSSFVRNILVSNGFDPEKTHVIYNPVHISVHRSNAKDLFDSRKNVFPQVLYVGRLDYEKGVEFLLEAVGQIHSKIDGLRLVVVGVGHMREQLEILANQLQIEHLVDFLGRVDDDQLLRLYCSSDLVVVPSVWPEPFGRVVVEAMMHKCPVIASRVGGILELVNSNSGILVPPKDVEALANSMIQILTHNITLSSNSDLRQKFCPERIADQILEVVKRLLQNRAFRER